MDDLMSGQDTVQDAIETAKDISAILKKGGFTLQKWASNCVDFLEEFQPLERSSNVKMDLKLDGTIKALGLSWDMGQDMIRYHLSLPMPPEKVTKRNILAEIQRLFDPLGWLAPALVPEKILIQKLWLKGVSWDEEVDPETKREWLEMRESYKHVTEVQIERWINTTEDTMKRVTLHGYCDASTKAYGAVVYLRAPTTDGEYIISLIAAKTRVAPVKPMTVPRLELCGAVLLSKLLKHISEALRIPSTQIFAWTDSTIVLSWLSGDPGRWQIFVGNRVVTILENVGNNWYHVQTSENPADVASRGMLLPELKSCKLWWHGPDYLKQRKVELKKLINLTTELEMRKTNIVTNLNIKEDAQFHSKFENFDTLNNLLKTITYATRFLNSRKEKNKEIDSTITTEELERSLQICIRIVQKETFKIDLENLKIGKSVNKQSMIKFLNPFIDDTDDILKVGGRLRHSEIINQQKHHIILDEKNPLTLLIVADAHARTLHGGIQMMMNFLRAKYWILKVRRVVKTCVRKCLICARLNAISKTQMMGDLPKQRVTPSRPFLNSGVDFAGPYDVLMSKGRGAKTKKSYIALFVCMATKAIHLELVGDLTSESFIGAFRRFVSRRGRCSQLWSDQGRNFVGANRELIDAWKEAKLQFDGQITETLANDGTQWHFIPAYSPHFGGLWEAGVRSMKYHLKRVLNTHLTYEEMSTILCQVEACLNSRPLCPIDDADIDSLDVLTPGHFLIGEAPLTVPSSDYKNVTMSNISRWRYSQKLLHNFLQRWQSEYLSRLQQRPKWLKKTQELRIGQIVLIKSDILPPGKWLLGRIVDKHPGSDGVTRVYSVKSGHSVVKRTITKLCLMPIDNE